MIGSFPDGYPDELLYSICARYTERVRYPCGGSVFRDLFGTERIKAVIDFPSHLGYLLTQLAPGNRYSLEVLANEFTLFPYYAPFLSAYKRQELYRSLIDQGKQGLHYGLGTAASGIQLSRCIKYCPVCVQKDRESYGEAYWHRLHQVPGIWICPHHSVWLEESAVAAQNSKVFTSAENAAVPHDPRAIDPHNPAQADLLVIAEDTYWLLNQANIGQDLDALRARYLQILFEQGYATYNGRVKKELLNQRFRERFSPSLLSSLDSELNEDIRNNWLAYITQLKYAQPPIRHLLMMRFLDITADYFFHLPVRQEPFGSGPWPCLSKVCKSYRKLIITRCKIGCSRAGSRKPLGIFTCPECGFTYCRAGPDRASEDIYQVGQILNHGALWEETLHSLWVGGHTYREMATVLGASTTTIRTQAQLLGLSGKQLNTECFDDSRSEIVPSDEELQALRSQWLSVCCQNSGAYTSKLINKNPKTYWALYRYDIGWLKANTPTANTEMQARPRRIDWKQRDKECTKLIRQAAARLSDSDGKPTRLTIKSILREAGLVQAVPYHTLDKLPRSSHLLSKLVETHEQFAIRRIAWVAERYQTAGIQPTRWQMIKRAGLSERMQLSACIQAALTAALEE